MSQAAELAGQRNTSPRLRQGLRYIHTDFFQRKSNIFPGYKKPTGSHLRSDSAVSVGPKVRSYPTYVPILRTFFITEFREPGAPF